MKKYWDIIETWLKYNDAEEVIDDLNKRISKKQVESLNKELNLDIPKEYLEFLTIHNGQEGMSAYLFENWLFLSSENVLAEWEFLKNIYDKNNSDFNPAFDWREEWIPIGSNESGDYMCIDLEFPDKSSYGQIIEFYHADEKINIKSNSFKDYIKDFAKGLQAGDYRYNNIEFEEKIIKIN